MGSEIDGAMPSSASAPSVLAAAAHPSTLRFLLDHGADRIEHPGGTLFAHLVRTAVTLAEWGASEELVAAGLSHALYGTDGFPSAICDVERRPEVRSLLGEGAEAIVYVYAASDRSVTWDASDDTAAVPFRDRFTGERRDLTAEEATGYWTLTAANELDLLDRIPGAEVVIGPLERHRVWLLPAGRDAVAAARERYP